MLPYVALTLGILSRLLPSLLHHPGQNLTAVGSSLLFFGARRPARELPLAALVLAITDVLLTTVAFRLPFHPADYLLTWLWYLAIPLLGRALLRPPPPRSSSSLTMLSRTRSTDPFTTAPFTTAAPSPRLLPRATLAVLASASSFFLLSNGSVWLLSPLYPHTPTGLLACFTAGLPFFRNDLLSTGLSLALLLALPFAAPARLRPVPTRSAR